MNTREQCQHRKGTALVLLVIVCGGAGIAWYLQEVAPNLLEEEFLGSNLGFFLLINVNIILTLVFGFLTAKNLVKLILDRRRNILGSRLRSRLVLAFVGLALVPTVLLFLVAKGMLGSLFQGWFEPQVEASIHGGLILARHYYEDTEAQLRQTVNTVTAVLRRTLPPFRAGLGDDRRNLPPVGFLRRVLEQRLSEVGLDEMAILDERGRVLIRVLSPEVEGTFVPGASAAAVREARRQVVVRPERSIQGELLRAYAPLDPDTMRELSRFVDRARQAFGEVGEGAMAPYVVVVTRWVRPELHAALTRVVDAADDYGELKIYRRPLASSYLLALVVVTVLIVFAAVWVGFYLARTLTVPIQLLAAGTEEIAHGNLDHRIPEVGDDELSVLVRSFNKMTEDLKRTRSELEQRRRSIEAILANIDIGVISVDIESKVTTFNAAAAEMLGVAPFDQAQPNKELVRLLPLELGKRALELMNELYATREKLVTAEMSLYVKGETRHLQATATKLVDENGKILGAVILLDDLTELISAQRMSAWREVARRIAHEIKNPLTPIQLSAQRMQRRISSVMEKPLDQEERRFVIECTDTIVNQVEVLRALVNEFSRFARMPRSNPRRADLNALIEDTVRLYKEAHPEFEISLSLDGSVPPVDLDRDQITRAFVNLLDNAVASIEEGGAGRDGHRGEIRITSRFDDTVDVVTVSVADSGVGIPDVDKPKLFEPYFSKKKGGTGLGLAIVRSIVSDHNGFIRVRDNEPYGAVFIIELPVRQHAMRETDLPRRGDPRVRRGRLSKSSTLAHG